MAPLVPRSNALMRLEILSTLVDAVREFKRGKSINGVLLLAAAAFAWRFRGLGIIVSILLRLYRRFR